MSDSPIDTPAQSMKVPWDKTNINYVDVRDPTLIELPGGQELPLSPDGPIRYMKQGRGLRVHVADMLAFATGEKPPEREVPVTPGPTPTPPEPKQADWPIDHKSFTCNTMSANTLKPQIEPDDLLSAPNLLEVARRAYRCAGESQRELGRGPIKEMLYRLYTRLGDAAYAYQRDVLALKPGPLPLDIQPDLSKATNKAQDAVQFDRAELFYLGELLKEDACKNGLHMNAHELWVAVSAVVVVS